MADVLHSTGAPSGSVVQTLDSDGVLRVSDIRSENRPGKLLLDADPRGGVITIYACSNSGKWIRWLFQKSFDTYSNGLWAFVSAHSMRRVSNRLWEFEVIDELIGGGATGVVWIEGTDGGKSVDFTSDTVTEVFIGDGHGDEYPEPVVLGVSLDPVVVADGKQVNFSDGGSRVECSAVHIMQRSKLLRDRSPKQTLANSNAWCSQLKVWSFTDQSMRMSVSATMLSQFTGKVYLPLICTSTGFTAGLRNPYGSALSIPSDVDANPAHKDVDGVSGIIMWGQVGMVEIQVGPLKSQSWQNVDRHTIRTDGGYHKNYWVCGSGLAGVGNKIHSRINAGESLYREFTVKFNL